MARLRAGNKFFYWTVIDPQLDTDPLKCLCRCRCGILKKVDISNLIRRKTRSCKSCCYTATHRKQPEKQFGNEEWQLLGEWEEHRGVR